MILRIIDLSKHFGGLIALDQVSFAVQTGTIHSLIGPNGAGKTTLFNVISGLLPATHGAVEFAGQRITALPPHAIAAKGIARTFQNIRLFKFMTLLDNVRVGTHAWTKNTLLSALLHTRRHAQEEREVTRRARELLATYGLADRQHEFAQNLPYGDQRRVEILRALAQQPRLLLLDEPTAGMNSQESGELMAFIQHVRRTQGVTVLMIEHDMRVVMAISDRITVLDYGKKIAEGRAVEIQRNPTVIEAYLGRGVTPPGQPAAETTCS